MGRLASQRRGQPDRQENGRHRGGYRRLQEGQRAYVTQQAAMVGRMVRFFLGGQRKGLAQQCQTYQQEDKQRSPGKPTVATHTDSMVARSHGLSLPEMLGPPVEAGRWRAGHTPDIAGPPPGPGGTSRRLAAPNHRTFEYVRAKASDFARQSPARRQSRSIGKFSGTNSYFC